MTLRPTLAVLTLSCAIAACSSDSLDSAPDPAMGSWIGTWGSGSSTTPNDYTIILLAADSLHVIDGLPPFDSSTDAVGTWTRADLTVTGSYTYPGGSEIDLVGLLSDTSGTAGATLTGTWGHSPSATNGGGFVVARQ